MARVTKKGDSIRSSIVTFGEWELSFTNREATLRIGPIGPNKPTSRKPQIQITMTPEEARDIAQAIQEYYSLFDDNGFRRR